MKTKSTNLLNMQVNRYGKVVYSDENLLWFSFGLMLIQAVFKISTGIISASLVVQMDGFYAAGALTYFGSLLVVYHQKERPADDKYPHGYANRGTIIQLVVFCTFMLIGNFLLFKILRLGSGAFGNVGFFEFATSILSVALSVFIYLQFKKVTQGIYDEAVKDMERWFKKPIYVALVALVSVLLQVAGVWWAEKIGSIIIINVFMWGSIRSVYSYFFILTDKTTDITAIENITSYVERSAKGARIVDVKTRKMGTSTNVDVKAAFSPSATIEQVNAIEKDIEKVLKRKIEKVGRVSISWEY